MSALIYMFDNNTGIEMPEKIDVYPVEILLGSSIAEIKDSIPNTAKIFCVFTHLKDCDFIVSNSTNANRLKEIFDFGNFDYVIGVKESSMWYSNASINMIISDSVTLKPEQLGVVIKSLIGITNVDGSKNNSTQISEMYIVYNTRNSKILTRTPKYTEAVKVCDQNPCCAIKKKSNGEIIYRSLYGKVSIPTSSETQISKYKARVEKHGFRLKGLDI